MAGVLGSFRNGFSVVFYFAIAAIILTILNHQNFSKTAKEIRTDLSAKIAEEVKPIVKQLFDYQIPIAQVQKAGITTTGAECENELEELLKEYAPYRKEHKLWEATAKRYEYKVENNHLYKKLNDGEWEEIC